MGGFAQTAIADRICVLRNTRLCGSRHVLTRVYVVLHTKTMKVTVIAINFACFQVASCADSRARVMNFSCNRSKQSAIKGHAHQSSR